jgi:hypothetical protein
MYKDLSDIDTGAGLMINGEGIYQEGETDHNGTGTPEGWTADIYGLIIDVNGKEYTIPANAIGPDLLKALQSNAETELNNYY